MKQPINQANQLPTPVASRVVQPVAQPISQPIAEQVSEVQDSPLEAEGNSRKCQRQWIGANLLWRSPQLKNQLLQRQR